MKISKLFEMQIPARIKKLKQDLIEKDARMCVNRALLVTESYKQNEAQPILLKRALSLKKILSEIPIFIQDNSLIVGNPASVLRGAEIFPEMSVHWMERELDDFETRPHNRLKVSSKDKKIIGEKIYPYWKGKTVCDRLEAYRNELVQKATDCGLISNTHQWGALGHVALDFEKILKKGFSGLKKEVQQKKSTLNITDPNFLYYDEFYRAGEIICDTVMLFANRYSALAKEMSKQTSELGRKKELEKISEICRHVPSEPARNFHEALQSFWFVQIIPQIEANGYSITPGRFDQYMYPYLEKDLKEGNLKIDDALELLECLWLKFNEIIRVDDKDAAAINAGYASGQNLAISGLDNKGKDSTNLLSYMCLLANKHISLGQPNFTVRLHKETPKYFLKKVAENIGNGNGMPQILNDEVIIPGLLKIDSRISLSEARNYIPVGCDEIAVKGMWARSNGGYLNFAKVLELTLNNGKCALSGKSSGFIPKKLDKISSFEKYLDSFKEILNKGVEIQVAEANYTDIIHRDLVPLPFVSLLVDGCIDNGRDVTQGGAKYNFTGPVGVGAATTGDSLIAIKKIVFEEKRKSLKEFSKILNHNYKNEEILKQYIINHLPKFGNDNDEVDNLVVFLTSNYFKELAKYKNYRKGIFIPALYSVTAQIGLGNKTGATPDGRMAGEPLSDGLSPMYGRTNLGPTAALKSVTKIELEKAINGVIVNQRLTSSLLKSKEGIEKFVQLLRSFVRLGGFHWQFNVISSDILIDAQKNPGKYRDLVVRVAGYSAIFVELSKKAQDSIIARNAAEL
jgi:pyruvate formate-lyase/glycerol dehydratase family glycyl radical enzyme